MLGLMWDIATYQNLDRKHKPNIFISFQECGLFLLITLSRVESRKLENKVRKIDI